jgi:hypothetical protein
MKRQGRSIQTSTVLTRGIATLLTPCQQHVGRHSRAARGRDGGLEG